MKPALPLPVSLALLLLHLAALSASEAPSPLPVQCAANLAAMSSCLPHLAALPENATSTPSAACCQAFAAAIDGAGGGASCLCDLVRRPFLLGSRLENSRLDALPSSCGNSVGVEASSFAEICQDSRAKPERKVAAFPSADDSEDDSGSVDPDRRGRGGRRQRAPRAPPSPPRRNPTPSPPRVEPEPNPSPRVPLPPGSDEPPPPPASGAARPPPIPAPEGPPPSPIPEYSADCRRGKLFPEAVLFLLSIFFALC